MPLHEMWARGECDNGHALAGEDWDARRCLRCKKAKDKQRKNVVGPVRFEYREPVVNNQRWFDGAICFGMDPAEFFPEAGSSLKEARKVCGNCPLATRRDCLADSLALDEYPLYGFRGGLSPRDRSEVKQGRQSFEELLGLDGEPEVSVPIGYETKKAIQEIADLARAVA